MELLSTLYDKLAVKDSAIIALTGSGGKTTLLVNLAKYYREKGYRVLISTTCKMYKDFDYETNYVFTDLTDEKIKEVKKGESALYYSATYLNKILVSDLSDFKILKPFFDIIIYEADGSATLALKIHNSNEPVVLEETTHTICIFSAFALGKNTLEVVHRETENKIVDLDYLESLLRRKDGVYTNSKGSVITLLNAIDTVSSKQDFKQLEKYGIIKTSIKNNEVYL